MGPSGPVTGLIYLFIFAWLFDGSSTPLYVFCRCGKAIRITRNLELSLPEKLIRGTLRPEPNFPGHQDRVLYNTQKYTFLEKAGKKWDPTL